MNSKSILSVVSDNQVLTFAEEGLLTLNGLLVHLIPAQDELLLTLKTPTELLNLQVLNFGADTKELFPSVCLSDLDSWHRIDAFLRLRTTRFLQLSVKFIL